MAEEKKVRLRCTYSPDYRSFFVSDGLGGVGEDGHIALDLYNEYLSQPEELVGKMLSDKRARVEKTEAPITVVRESQVRLYLTPQGAIRIGEWLTKHGEDAIKPKGQ